MYYKTILLFAWVVASSACAPENKASSPDEKNVKQHITATETTDEVDNKTIHIKSKRDEGYTAHPSSQIEKTTNKFYCEGHTAETIVVKQVENQEVRSLDLIIRVNSEKIDLTPVIGRKPNLYGYSNLETHFSCVDQGMGIIIDGQPYTHDNQLAPSTNIVDFLVDRNTGYIKSTSRTTRIED